MLLFLAVATPVTAFYICYQMFDVPDPMQVTLAQNQTITLYYSDGKTELGRILPPGGGGNRTLVRFDQIPQHVQNAVLAAEDNSFWTNSGFDVTGIMRAAFNNLIGASGGGSTITQQYIKKATGNEDHSFSRKWRELVLAKKITDTYSKENLLTAYLNTVYFGRGANGIQAAARAYFGKDIQQVNVSEAALLAGVIQRPTFWDPDVDRENAERRWNFVLDQMVNQKWLPSKDGLAFPATLPRDAGTSSAELQIQNQVLAELEERADLPRDEAHAKGLRVITTIDRAAQQAAEQAVKTTMDGQPDYLRAAVVSIDPNTGGIIAYHGGGNGKGLDYAQTWQEPGTAFGPFTGAAALTQGFRLDSPLEGSSPRTIGGIPMTNPPGADCSPCTLRRALQQPVNTAIAGLANKIGPDFVAEIAYQLGIPRELRGKPTLGEKPDTRIAIGMGSTIARPIDMSTAYATLAADGVRTNPHFVDRVEYSSGNIRYRATLTSQQVVPPRVARQVTEAMNSPKGLVGAIRPGVRPFGENGAVAKAWMTGYTHDLATVVWMGSDQLKAIKNKSGADITPFAEPAAIWRAVMEAYNAPNTPTPAARPIPSTR
ncbi:transglycosylase domain-containing protein [Actinocrispum sp. NPDC049592]|uniref:transglycosylase domain-containing protein n=1 Tax=Actinocrispum sp. NPDC049592 TaxID=3154835 RepID=UPI0034192CF5